VCVCDVRTGTSETERVTRDETIRYDDGEYDEETENASTVANETKRDKETCKGPRNRAGADGSRGSVNDRTAGGRIRRDLWSIA
jgi:hypothetical protein